MTQDQPPILISDEMLAPDPHRGRTDFERGMSYVPALSIALIAANCAVFAWELASGALDSQESIVRAGALHRGRVLAGEAWRLLSAIFLHGGFDHLAGNCLALYVLGLALEHAFGRTRAAVVYFFAGLCGSLLSLAMSPGPSVGASGAIFGVQGAVIAFLYRYRAHFYVRDKRIGFVLLMWAIYQIGSGFLTPHIDNFAHIGGLVGGAAVALVLRARLETPAPDAKQT